MPLRHLVVALLMVAGCAAALWAAPDTPPPRVEMTAEHQKLFEEKCSQCHALDRVRTAHASGAAMDRIIHRMQHKEGARISADEAEAIERWFDTIKSLP